MAGMRFVVVAVAMAFAGRVGATPPDEGSGGPFARATHASRESTDVRLDVAPQLDRRITTAVAPAGGGGALVIDATYDSTITTDPNAAAIETMIENAISVHESLFNDPIVVSILFRYSTTYANGTTPLPLQELAVSESGLYRLPWSTYIGALPADATTANDATAIASLPVSALAANIDPTTANGRGGRAEYPARDVRGRQLGSRRPIRRDRHHQFGGGVQVRASGGQRNVRRAALDGARDRRGPRARIERRRAERLPTGGPVRLVGCGNEELHVERLALPSIDRSSA